MLRYINIFLSKEMVAVDGVVASVQMSALFRDRDSQDLIIAAIGRRGIMIHLNDELCHPKTMEIAGVAIPYFEPDPLVYLPFIDFITVNGISIRGVTRNGVYPWHRVVRWGDGVIAIVCVCVIGLLFPLHDRIAKLESVADANALRISRDALNVQHIRQSNQDLLNRVKRGIEWVRSGSGQVIQFQIEDQGEARLDAVFPIEELGRSVVASPWVDIVPLNDQWVSVHVTKLE